MNLPFRLACVVAVMTTSSASPINLKRGVDPSLIPEFGLSSGINPTGTGDCDGIKNAAGQIVKIPCFCPPDRNSFIQSLNANTNAGKVVNNPSIKVTFPTDDSKGSQLARLQTAIVTLQNLEGPGVGCPAASTTFLAQQKAIRDASDTAPAVPSKSPSVSPPPSAPTTTAPASATGGVNPALVPEFGLASGINPTGTGDCDGIKNDAGKVVKIPCQCPPNREVFIQKLNANVAAGKVTTNPSISVSFPTDDSKASKLTRLQAAIVTLQNLDGPGKGCPAASSTFLAQQKAIQNGQAATPTPAPAPTPTPAGGGFDPKLVPDFGFVAGLNPTVTGDCDGITNDAGKVVKIPCSCPPNRDVFIQKLRENVAAGKAVNNPSVTVLFPTDDSKASKVARLQAALVTLQNLDGAGKGCPAASTTFVAQQKAIQNSF